MIPGLGGKRGDEIFGSPASLRKDWLLGFVLTPVGAGAILYFILGSVPFIKTLFLKLSGETKELVVMLLAFGVPLVGMAVAMAFAYLPVTEDVIFNALQVGFLAWSGNQAVRAVKRILA